MSNPIFSSFNNNGLQNNNKTAFLINAFKQAKNSSNPNQVISSLLSGDSDYQKAVNYINQNGGDARAAYYNLAAQMGVKDPDSLINTLKQFF